MVQNIAVVGLGEIARAQHLPEIAASAGFRLGATVDPSGAGVEGVAHYSDLGAMLAAEPGIGAVALCTPPQVRFALARQALAAGRDVLLEKPPGVTVSELATLERLAVDRGAVLFTAWHSQFAPAVEAARDWLAARHRAGRRVTGGGVIWREDVRQFHPGQDWIFEPGGTGVFDPGINALSVLTAILPVDLRVTAARFDRPANRAAPIGAVLSMTTEDGAPLTLDFDFREQGPPRWDIEIETDDGTLALSRGGAVAAGPGISVPPRDGALPEEYRRIYERFAALIAARRSEVDAAPMRHMADAFLLARWAEVEPFAW